MGYIDGTTNPKVLQEREVKKIDPQSCFLRRYPNAILPVWLGHGSCFIGHNGEARYLCVLIDSSQIILIKVEKIIPILIP